jgi:hypothetical protein
MFKFRDSPLTSQIGYTSILYLKINLVLLGFQNISDVEGINFDSGPHGGG